MNKLPRQNAWAISCLLLLTVALLPASAQSTRRRSPASSSAFEQLTKRAAEARQADKLEAAIPLYRQALQQQPKWIEGWWALGTIYYQQDRYAEGREAFRRLVALEPKGGIGWAFLGLCEYRLQAYDNALTHLLRGRELGLGSERGIAAVALYHTGILLNRAEQFELAFVVLSLAANYQGESRTLFEALGLTLLRLPHLPPDIPAAKREVVLKTGRAGFYMATKQRDLAAQEFSELLAVFPNEPNVHYAHGISLMRDAPEEGLRAFERELQISPQHVFAMLQIAFEYLKRKEFEAALPYAEKAAQLAPKLFAAHNALGRILLELGQTERAIKALELSAKQAPDSPESQFALARAYAKAGRKAEAEKARSEFTRLDKLRRAKNESFVGDKPDDQAKPE